ncbi:MAG: hypothetical protein ACPGJS_19375 [Flammeovirgaceae bacterium]
MKNNLLYATLLLLSFWMSTTVSFGQHQMEPIAKSDALTNFEYIIRPYSIADRVNLDITAIFVGSSTGKTDIFLPRDRYGTKNIYTAVSAFNVKNGVSLAVFEKPYVRSIRHKPNAKLEINYTLSIDPELTKTSSFSPVIEPEIFHFFWPQWTLRLPNDSLRHSYSIEFKDLPDSWVASSNLPKNQEGKYVFHATQENFKPLILGGNYDHYTIEIDQKPVEVMISYHFRGQNLLENVKKLLTFQRRFFDFQSNNQYLVSVTKRDGILGGTAIQDAFVALIRKGADKKDILNLLAHETFHNWVPLMADIYVDPNELGSEFKSEFFNEGFADYIPKVILLDEGLISKAEVIELLNKTLLSYAKSPVNTISYAGMQEVIRNYEYNYKYEKISYYRGDLIAFKWDNIIRKSTKNKKNILHFIHEVIEKALESDGKLTFDAFFKIANQYGIKAQKDWQNHIIDGKKIKIQKLGWLSDNYQLITLTEPFYEPGFKVNQSKREGKIDGVVRGSNAFNAGLRNGMKIVELNVSKEKSKEMELLVEIDKTQKLIKYFPSKEVTYQKVISK